MIFRVRPTSLRITSRFSASSDISSFQLSQQKSRKSMQALYAVCLVAGRECHRPPVPGQIHPAIADADSFLTGKTPAHRISRRCSPPVTRQRLIRLRGVCGLCIRYRDQGNPVCDLFLHSRQQLSAAGYASCRPPFKQSGCREDGSNDVESASKHSPR